MLIMTYQKHALPSGILSNPSLLPSAVCYLGSGVFSFNSCSPLGIVAGNAKSEA